MKNPLPSYEKIAVFGLGASGLAAAQLLDAYGKKIIASDSADPSRRDEFLAKLPANEQLFLGKNEIADAEIIVTSPGLEPSSPIFAQAAQQKIPIIAELELGFLAADKPIVAITGTDGKTTTTTLTAHILKTCGIPNHMGGNVGIPLSHVVLESHDDACFVVETSAFQLCFCPQFRPHILIATNIAEDHAEYFKGDWKGYVSTKRKPLNVMTEDDIAILNASDPEMRGWNVYTKAQCLWYGASRDDLPTIARHYACIEGKKLLFHVHDVDHTCPIAALKLKGEHNLMNIMASVLAALEMGCPFEAILDAIETYTLPPHRIQDVRTLNGIRFIDDSKATNPHAAIAALKAIDEPTALIVGGLDKGLSLSDWIDLMRKNVRVILAIGALTERFCREAQKAHLDIPIHRCQTLEEAVQRGYQLARENGCHVVMLSPACSSYDMFKSYGQRGDIFAKAAREIEA